LHTPSDVALKQQTACHNIFIDKYDSVKHPIAVFSKLHNICLIKLNELCEDAGLDISCGPCVKDNLNKCIFLFLKVNLHHIYVTDV
jgi:hypothetical protein